jgi:transcriptional regulator with XRE-family HTH domain
MLDRLCRERGWTYRELSRRSGVSYQSISDIRLGKTRDPGATVLARLADALGVSVDTLLGRAYPSGPGTNAMTSSMCPRCWGTAAPAPIDELRVAIREVLAEFIQRWR